MLRYGDYRAHVQHTTLVSKTIKTGVCSIIPVTDNEEVSVAEPCKRLSSTENDDTDCFTDLGKCLIRAGLSEHTAKIVLASWRGTNNMGHISEDGVSFVVGKRLISFTHL